MDTAITGHFCNQSFCKIPAALILAILILLPLASQAGPLRDRLIEHRLHAEPAHSPADPAWPPDIRIMRDLSYGSDSRQTMDLYLPARSTAATPIILMVHGGAWRTGDKAARKVIANKVGHWLPLGFAFISLNYRMLPDTLPRDQADDIARALGKLQQEADRWGLDRQRLILIGHSAGAHLVSLLAASGATGQAGLHPWRATIALDSAALDVPAIMEKSHYPFYDAAFGRNPQYWVDVSPLHQLHSGAPPFLLVCSSTRADGVCGQARDFSDKAKKMGIRAEVLPQSLSHQEINEQLGTPGSYTDAVDNFIKSVGGWPDPG